MPVHCGVGPVTRATITLLAWAAVAGCQPDADVVCGFATSAVDGRCEIDPVTELDCGPGTHLDAAAKVCVLDEPIAQCGPGAVDVAGVCTCSFVGDCAGPIACPPPTTANTTTLCGLVVDAQTSDVVAAEQPNGVACDPAAPTPTGPCALTVRVFDALALAGNPTGTDELPVEDVVIDDCGRFRAFDVQEPPTGHIALAFDGDGLAPSVAVAQTAGGARTDGIRAFVVRGATDDAWTQSAGRPFADETFVDVGVVVVRFSAGDTPATGVTVDGAFYFDDVDPASLSSVDPAATATGPNGAALVIDQPLGTIEAAGGLPDGCDWQTALTASIPGFAVVSEATSSCPP